MKLISLILVVLLLTAADFNTYDVCDVSSSAIEPATDEVGIIYSYGYVIKYTMHTKRDTQIKMYDVLGREVDDFTILAGETETTKDYSHLGSGMYFVQVDGSKAYKILMLK